MMERLSALLIPLDQLDPQPWKQRLLARWDQLGR